MVQHMRAEILSRQIVPSGYQLYNTQLHCTFESLIGYSRSSSISYVNVEYHVLLLSQLLEVVKEVDMRRVTLETLDHSRTHGLC